jgi:hypothetical protein
LRSSSTGWLRAQAAGGREQGGAMSGVVKRAARVAFTFVMMNYSALAGLFALWRGREVWK